MERDEGEKSRADAKKDENKRLPELSEGQVLDLLKLDPRQHFTQPPPRYSESSLVKELEEKGIGRPSTYASILSTIQDRGYVEREKGRFSPTDLGSLVNDFLVDKFPRIMNEEFTAQMENDLDRVEEGSVGWVDLLSGFYKGFSESLTLAERASEEQTLTDVECEKCGSLMGVRLGKYGQFLACSNYPDCKNTKDFRREDGKIVIEERTGPEVCEDVSCGKCGKPMVVKKGRYGEFLACSGYPECKNTEDFERGEDGRITVKERTGPEVREDVSCGKCGKPMVVRSSRRGKFLGCSGYPKCRSTLNLDKDGNVVEKAAEKKKT